MAEKDVTLLKLTSSIGSKSVNIRRVSSIGSADHWHDIVVVDCRTSYQVECVIGGTKVTVPPRVDAYTLEYLRVLAAATTTYSDYIVMPSHLSCILREYVNTTPQFLPSRSSLGPATIPPNTLCTLCLFKLLPLLSIPHTFSSTSGLTSPTTPHDPSTLSYPF